jgi:DNA repair exonuclease SbcCD ATPase subunit
MSDSIILNKKAKINRVFFLADIHIKNSSEHDEKYKNVFDATIKKFKEMNIGETDLIVVLGDILDERYSITPSATILLKYLYHELTNLTNVCSILGNHEYDVVTKKNTLVPIIGYHFPTKYANHILTEDKNYLFGNINLSHTFFESTKVTSCEKYKKKYTNISIFHGIINGTKSDGDHVKLRSQFSVGDFKGCDYLACGDIHRHQYLNKKQTAFYPGSLLGQKSNEFEYPHGFMMLNIKTGKSKLYPIECSHLKLKMTYDDLMGKFTLEDLKKKDTLDISLITTCVSKKKQKEIDKMKEILKENCTTVNFDNIPSFENIKLDTEIKINNKTFSLSDLKTRSQFNDFLCKFVMSRHDIKNKNHLKDDIDTLLDDANVTDNLGTEEKNVKLLKIKFSNILKYGENVEIDFEGMNGAYGIHSTNSSGKSSALEMLSIIMYARSPRCDVLKSFIRKGQTKCSGSVSLKVNDIKYQISREIKTASNKETTNVVIKKTNSSGKKTIYTNDKLHVNKNKVIFKNYKSKDGDDMISMLNKILSYDEIYQNIIFSQEREKSFIKCDDKYQLLLKVSGYNFLNQVIEKCSKDFSSMKKAISTSIKTKISKTFMNGFVTNSSNRNNYKKMLEHVNEQIKIQKETINDKTLTDKYNISLEKYNEGREKIIKYEENLKNLCENSEMYEGYDNMIEENELNQKTIDENDEEIEEMEETIDEYKKELSGINKKLKKYKNMEEKHKTFLKEKNENIKKINEKIKNLQENKKHVDKLYETNKKEYTKAKKEINNTQEEIDEVEEDIKLTTKKIKLHENVNKVFVEYKIYIDKKINIDVSDKVIDILESLSLKENKLNKKIKELKNQKKVDAIEIKKYNEYKDNYNEYNPNENVNDNISKLYKKRDNLNKNKQKNIVLVENYNNSVNNKNINEEIEELEDSIDDEKNKCMDDYETYMDLTNNNEIQDRKMNNLIIKMERLRVKNDKMSNSIEKNNNLISEVKKDKKKYKKYCKLKEEYDEFLKSFKKIKNEYERLTNEKQEEDVKNKKIENEIIIAEHETKKHVRDVETIENYEIINECLKINGIADIVIKNIVNNLQKAIDEMCIFIGHEKTNIKYHCDLNKVAKKINITITTAKTPDIVNSGGFQSKLIDLLFKLAFIRINVHMTTDIMIIDEIYDACSVENFPMIKKLIEFFRIKFKKMLIVSHNPDIINLFDKTITIINNNEHGNNISMPN